VKDLSLEPPTVGEIMVHAMEDPVLCWVFLHPGELPVATVEGKGKQE
jgi:hypothetical protein